MDQKITVPKTVQRVMDVLKKARTDIEIRNKRLKAVGVVFAAGTYRGADVYVRFKDGSWSASGEMSEVDGVVDGFNVCAYQAVYALATLGYFRKEDAEAFVVWYRQREKEINEASKLSRARETADEFGYDLVKQVKA